MISNPNSEKFTTPVKERQNRGLNVIQLNFKEKGNLSNNSNNAVNTNNEKSPNKDYTIGKDLKNNIYLSPKSKAFPSTTKNIDQKAVSNKLFQNIQVSLQSTSPKQSNSKGLDK